MSRLTDRFGPAGRATWTLALALLAMTTGCYNYEEVQTFLQEPRRPVAGVEYRVYPPDSISIASTQVPEINGAGGRIRPDGKLNLPLLGEVYVAGMTPDEIEETLMAAASDYYEQVDATVQVTGYNSQFFYVFGQVGSAGPQAWTGRDSLLNVLARAQPTPLAWPQRIIVIRGEQPQVGGYLPESEQGEGHYAVTGVRPEREDRPRERMTINLYAMIRKGDMSNNVLLMPNDIVYVQPNPLAAVGLGIQNLLFPVRPAFSAASVPSQAAGVAAGGAGVQ